MLVSRNDFHVVSALQSIVCHYIFFAEMSCKSYVSSVFRMRSPAVSGFSFKYCARSENRAILLELRNSENKALKSLLLTLYFDAGWKDPELARF